VSKANKNSQPHWRPNFVNASELPDIKAVRTDFIINFFAVVLMLLTGFYLLQREYKAHSLKKEIDVMEQQIRAAEADDAAYLKLSQEFHDLAVHIAELEKFYATPVQPHEFLTQLTKMRPEELIFKQISLVEALEEADKKKQIVYRINISGEVRSLKTLDEFKGDLSEWALLNVEGYGLEIDESLQGRDAETGIFPYTLEITLRLAKSAAATKSEGAEA
jgi:hypothetical protein